MNLESILNIKTIELNNIIDDKESTLRLNNDLDKKNKYLNETIDNLKRNITDLTIEKDHKYNDYNHEINKLKQNINHLNAINKDLKMTLNEKKTEIDVFIHKINE